MLPRNQKGGLQLGETKNPPKFCPFMKQTCTEEKCELWSSIKFMAPGRLAGAAYEAEMQGCTFVLQLFIMQHPAPIALQFPGAMPPTIGLKG